MPLHQPIFTLVFLPGVLLLYALVRRWRPRWSAATLLVGSLLFYVLGDHAHLPLVAGLIAVNYAIGRALCAGGSDRRLNRLLAAGIAIDVGALALAKAGLAPAPAVMVGSSTVQLTGGSMPLGLSFFVVQQITWLAEMRRNPVPSSEPLGPVRFATYSMFFPQMVAGPILHYPHAAAQYQTLGRTPIDRVAVARGLSVFIVGLAKKTLIADPIGRVADPLFDAAAGGHALTFVEAWVAGWAYLLQLYFDFSGLSDMALGIGLMVGLRLPINFNSPLKARGASECFDRWHISLTMFVRNYLFSPIYAWVRPRAKGTAARRSIVAWATATIVSLSLVGWWHGARATFVISGFLIGVFSVALQLRAIASPRGAGRTGLRPAIWGRLAIGIELLVFGIFFRAPDLAATKRILLGLVQPWHISVGERAALMLPDFLRGRIAADGFLPASGIQSPVALGVLMVASLLVYLSPNTLQVFQLWDHPGAPARDGATPRLVWRASAGWALAMGLLATAAIVASASGEVRAAIYGRF